MSIRSIVSIYVIHDTICLCSLQDKEYVTADTITSKQMQTELDFFKLTSFDHLMTYLPCKSAFS